MAFIVGVLHNRKGNLGLDVSMLTFFHPVIKPLNKTSFKSNVKTSVTTYIYVTTFFHVNLYSRKR